jgi:hypothetical protein
VVITLCAGVWNQELESICALSAQKKLVSLLYVVSDINQTKTGFFQHLKIKKFGPTTLLTVQSRHEK